jgi:SH3-like domain-containing protein
MIRKTFYDTLQVSRHASPSVIRAAYKALSQKHHPDKHPDDLETAHKNMKRLNEAYDVLSDSVRKAAYDEHIEALIVESMQGATRASPPSSPPAPPRPRAPPPPPAAPAPPPAYAKLQDGDDSPVGVIACIVIAVVLAAAVISSRSNSTGTESAVAPAPPKEAARAPVPETVPVPPSMPTLAVAAVNANVRKEPSAKSKAIALLARGTPIEQISNVNGFVKFNLSDGREGWISRDVVVPRTDAIRLGGLSATDYANARVPLRGLEQLFAALEPYRELQVQALFQIATESAQLDGTLTELASKARITSDNVDSEAASWYSLEAKYYADNNKPADGFQSARAAVLADPANVDAHVAFAYAAVNVGELGVVKGVATVLPTLAPNSTNTWVIVGVSAAAANNSVLAINALLLALRKSRNAKVTVQVLADLASRSSEPKVSQAINTALERWSQKS